MAVWYLDNEDEITDAVARLRNTTDSRVVFVVPAGSRIATGRINFKLLAREAASRDLSMAVASPDEQVRSMALAAGVLTLPTAEEAEAALERGDVAPTPDAGESSGVAAMEIDEDAASAAQSAAAHQRTQRRRLSIALVVVVALVVLGGVTSLETLPTAEIDLVPRTVTVGPIEVPVTALASVDTADPERGRIPAVDIKIPLEVEGTFPSSGVESLAKKAAGVVSFSSDNQTFDLGIAAGTRVETEAGVAFQTVAEVVLPRSPDGTGPSRVLASIEAVEAGPAGNVESGAITVVTDLGSPITVINPEPTTGGDLRESPVVTEADYSRYAARLTNQLGTSVMDARLRQPEIVPEGLTLFPETRKVGQVSFEPVEADVVGQPLSEFTLRGVATGQAVAVDLAEVESMAVAALMEVLPDGMQMSPESIRVDTGSGTAIGRDIEFKATAVGEARVAVDTGVLRSKIAGLPISEAQAILEALGAGTVTVWPDFLGDLPNDPNRITLHVQEPSTAP